MKRSKKKIIFVDGENFRQGLVNSLLDQKLIKDKNVFFKMDIRGLIEDAIGEQNLNINYYASEIKTPNGYKPSKEITEQICMIREKSRRWVVLLKQQGINYIKAGNLKVKEGKKCAHCHMVSDILQEKGVDVRVALDMLEVAYEKPRTDIVVISSDTDLCPTYHKIRAKKLKVVYACFSERVNRAVVSATNEVITITPQKVKQYFLGIEDVFQEKK